MTSRPNILFAIADDASHMGAYGHGFVKTPAFDRVAREGVLFNCAFTTNPKCAPSRASILTGKHTWQLEEASCHFSLFPSKFQVFPSLLENSCYAVGFTGKGWAPGDWKAGGFTRNPAGPEWNRITLRPPEGSNISNKDYAANFAEFLDAKKSDQPFCFWYGGHEPHRGYAPGEGQRAGKDPATIPVPPYLPDDPIVRADLCDYAYEIEWFDQHLGLMLRELEDRGLLEDTLVVVTSDNGMPFPRVKGQMYECDFKLPLAIMWPAKISGGRISSDLVSFTDFAPTILEAAGLPRDGAMAGKSLMPILQAEGSGILDPGREDVVMGREKHDLGSEDDLGYPVRCLRDHRYLYVRNFAPDRWPAGNPETGFTNCDSSPTKDLILEQRQRGTDYFFNLAFGQRPSEELYDIVMDEPCLHNLALDSKYDAVRKKMRERMDVILQETGDPRIFGRGEIFETYPYVGSFEHSWKAYKDGSWKKQTY